MEGALQCGVNQGQELCPASGGSAECPCHGHPPQGTFAPALSQVSQLCLPSLHSLSSCTQTPWYSLDRAPGPSVDHTETYTQETSSWRKAEGGLSLHHLWHLLSTVLIVPNVSISQMKTHALTATCPRSLSGKCHSQDSNPGSIPEGPNCWAMQSEAEC